MNFFPLLAALAGFATVASAQSSPTSSKAVSSAATSPKPTSSAAMVNTKDTQCLGLVGQIPPCGLLPLTSYGSAKYGCELVDLACQCSNSKSIQSGIYSEVLTKCGPTLALDVVSGADQICACHSAGASSAIRTITQETLGLNPSGNKLCVSYGLAIPTCGTTALQSIASQSYGCGDFDFQCQCAHFTEIQSVASTPVINACGTTTALSVISAANLLCSCISANNNFFVTKAQANGSLPMSTTSKVAAAPTLAPPQIHVPFVPIGGVAGFFSLFAGVVAWL